MAALCYSETFSPWMEQTTNIPTFDEIIFPPDDNSQNNETNYHLDVFKPQHHQSPQQQQYRTQSLLEEFETVLGGVGTCHQTIPQTTQEQTESLTGSSTLTPPESPQQDIGTKLLVTLHPLDYEDTLQTAGTVVPEIVQSSSPVFPSNETEVVYNTIVSVENPFVNSTSSQWNTVENISLGGSLDGDVANDFAVVEEYVRSHTKDIQSPSSPCNSSSSSSAGDTTDDPDWNVVQSKKNNSKPTTSRNHQKLYRQYFRPSIEDKKVRKKEQNKNAATRYRQKKKQEIKDIEGEEHELTEINGKLKDKVTEMKREIKCLKGLLRELYKAKGVLQ
ncbi:activating transcription factor of chaperone isoform X2 [Odontomachus brunneus]|uniref:activating transcription factor of chaperone isoform X2 n=1 Tax=Odontomachus brunneus TaxID=486640 RepID=UPI0013F197F1|nr:activating transcription factor of chaperone isoform X2 [Odontomachus brunneus]